MERSCESPTIIRIPSSPRQSRAIDSIASLNRVAGRDSIVQISAKDVRDAILKDQRGRGGAERHHQQKSADTENNPSNGRFDRLSGLSVIIERRAHFPRRRIKLAQVIA